MALPALGTLYFINLGNNYPIKQSVSSSNNYVNIHIDLNGGTAGSFGTEYVVEGLTQALLRTDPCLTYQIKWTNTNIRPTRSGYNLTGWTVTGGATDDGGNTLDAINFVNPSSTVSTITIRANWQSSGGGGGGGTTTYTVTFNINKNYGYIGSSGTYSVSRTYTSGAQFSSNKPSNPTLSKSTYVFLGWFNNSGMRMYDSDTVNSSMTVSAYIIDTALPTSPTSKAQQYSGTISGKISWTFDLVETGYDVNTNTSSVYYSFRAKALEANPKDTMNGNKFWIQLAPASGQTAQAAVKPANFINSGSYYKDNDGNYGTETNAYIALYHGSSLGHTYYIPMSVAYSSWKIVQIDGSSGIITWTHETDGTATVVPTVYWNRPSGYSSPEGFTLDWTGAAFPLTDLRYAIAWNKGDGTGTNGSGTKYYKVNYTLPGSTFTKTGYTQNGWATSSGGSKVYNLSASYTTDSNLTIYPSWAANTYTITLNQQSGSGGTASVTATYGSAMPSATMPTRTGYTFGGYYDGTGGSGTQYYTATGASARTWNKTAATTLYAKWTAKTYTVTVNLNGGTGGPGSSFTATYGTNKSLTAPTKAGYDFVGWACTGGSRLSQDFSAATGFFTAVPSKYIWGGSGTNNSTIALATMDTASGFPNTLKMITITEPGTSTKAIGFHRRASDLAESTNYLITFVAKAPLNTYFYIFNSASYEGTGYTWEYLTPMAGTGNWQTYCIKLKTGTSITNNYTGYYVLCGNATTVSTSTCPGNISYNIAWTGIGTYSKFNAACTYVPADISSDTIYALWIEKKYTISYNLNGGSLSSGTDTIRTSSSYKEALNPLSAQWNRSPYALGTANAQGTGKPTANSSSAWFYVERPTKASSVSSSTSPITTSFSAASAVTAIGSTKTITTTTPQNFYSWTITGMDSSTHHYWGRTGTAVTTNSSQAFTSTSITLTAAHNTGGVPLEFYNLRQSAGTVTFTAGWTNGTATSATTYSNITLPTVPGKSNTTATTTRTVYYNANGGTGTTTAQSVTPSATVTWSDDDKWYTASSGGTGYAQGLTTYKPTASATLYAHYTASTGTYSSPTIALHSALTFASVSTTTTTTATVNFNAASAVTAKTTTKTVTSTQPKKFDKWRLGSTTGTSYTAGQTFTPTASATTFYATSTNNGSATTATVYGTVTLPNVPAKSNTTDTITRTVSYNRNGSTSATPTTQSVSPTATVTWADDDKWYTAASGGTGYTQGGNYTLTTDNGTLYAHYTGTTGTYSSPTISLPAALTFASVSTTTTTTATLNFSAASAVTAKTTTKTVTSTQAKTFDKWRLGSATGTSYAANATFTPTTGSTTFYATSKNNGSATAATVYGSVTLPNVPAKSATTATITRTVYFDANGGTVSSSSLSVSPTATVTWSDDDKWYTSSSGGTGTAQGSNYTLTADNATLYAHYTSTTGSYNSPTITLPTPTQANKNFDGWYSGTTRVGGGGDSYTPTTASITLTAQWSNAYCVFICTANGWKRAIPYVCTANGWKASVAYVCTANGWKPCGG